jgi:phosphoribosylaminoimidazole carboxylase (NCAIR synthetase)
MAILEIEIGRIFMYAEIEDIVWEDGPEPVPSSTFGQTKMEATYSVYDNDGNSVEKVARPEDVGTEDFENWRAYVTSYLIDKAQNYEQRGIVDCSPARMKMSDGTWL